ncbi:MAG: GNAT family N-acetyltransferase [Alphaproteobacteria bacterium]|nr:GNAT family N-acetyltransferase [Alphaproteobacteria bacterium]
MPCTIRPAIPADTETLGRIHAQAWQETYAAIMPPDIFAKLSTVDARTAVRRDIFAFSTPRHGHFIVENETGDAVGFGDCGPARETGTYAPAEITTLYLLRRAQGQGLGGRLLVAMLEHLAAQGFASVALKALTANEQAKGFYRHMGGRQAAEIPGDKWVETIYVWDDLNAVK